MEAEREGFSRPLRENILRQLDLRLKSLSDPELEQLRALLIVHGFLSR